MEFPMVNMAPTHFNTLYGIFTIRIQEIWTQG